MLDDLELLPTGYAHLPDDFWQTHGDKMESWQDEAASACYRVSGPLVKDWYAEPVPVLARRAANAGWNCAVDAQGQ